MEHKWIFQKCREVQESPDGHLDLWAREHYKSTIITFGKTIQDILASHGEEPLCSEELTFCIFSGKKGNAGKFMAQIMRELETNVLLKEIFPDVLWANPTGESPKWSTYSGMVVRRKTNRKESTVEAHGLIDGMPTGGHYNVLIYDDVVTLELSRSDDEMKKCTEALSYSYNLGVRGGKRRMIGTRYTYKDSYGVVEKRGTFKPRIYPATADGTETGEPVLMSHEELRTRRQDNGPYIFASQMLQNPMMDSTQGFREEWLRYYREVRPQDHNLYIVVDPANSKKKKSDFTSMWVIGLGEDENYYVHDMVRDKWNLAERCRHLMNLHRKYRPIRVGYESYGMQADIEHLQHMMELESYRFELVPLAGKLGNEDRVKRLIPLFEQARVWLPISQHYTTWQGTTEDMVQVFREEEYKPFPVGMHADMLDSLSRILDEEMATAFPHKQNWAPINYDDRWIV